MKTKPIYICFIDMGISSKLPAFEIHVVMNGKSRTLKITPLETSDGAPYYSCHLDRQEISQVRKEIYGKWEQLWGVLDPEMVQHIGSKISEKITPP
ncbi:hypothetical protein D9M68_611710 [compost metagenome]